MSLDKGALSGFTGTETWHRWSVLFPRMLMTDGAKYVADHGGDAGAYWLMDAIASHQTALQKNPRFKDAQFWKLDVNKDKSARLTCVEDSGMPPAIEQEITYTDFDMDTLSLYCMPVGDGMNYTILLPSEY